MAAIGAPAPMETMAEARKLNTTNPLLEIPSLRLSQINPSPIPPVFISLEKMPMTIKTNISLELPYWARPWTTLSQYLSFSLQRKKPAKRETAAAKDRPFME